MAPHMVATYPDPAEACEYVDEKYLGKFRVDFATWQYLLRVSEIQLSVATTNYRESMHPTQVTGHHPEQPDPPYAIHRIRIFIRSTCTDLPCHQAQVDLGFETVPGKSYDKILSSCSFGHNKYGLKLCAGAKDSTFVHRKKPKL